MIWINANVSDQGNNIIEKSKSVVVPDQELRLNLKKTNPDGRTPVMGTSSS